MAGVQRRRSILRDWLHLRTNNNHTMTESVAIKAQSGLNIQLVLEEHNCHLHQFVMSDTDDVTAVEIGYKLDTPVENNLYE